MSDKKYTLGIDVGTTGTKAILFTLDGAAVARAYRGYPLITPKVGYSEQDANDWWRAIVETVNEIGEKHDIRESVLAISLSTQGGTLVPVDKGGNPVCPAIVWNDARGEEQKEKYISEVGPEGSMYKKTGWKLSPGLLAIEVRWLRDNKPEIFHKAEKFLSVPDFVSLKMTGIAAVDFSNAGINQTVDISEKKYDRALLDFMGVSEEKLPTLVSSGSVIGSLTEKASLELGLAPDTVLVSGAHDQYAVALGAGAVNDGDILIGSGTCWVVTAIGKEADFESGLAQSVSAVPGLWGSLLSLSTGGVCFDWLRKNIAKADDESVLDYDLLNQEVEKISAAEDGLFFFPFSGTFGGGKFFSRATFSGLDLSHNRFHLARAIMEGIVFQILWFMESFKTKPKSDGLKLSGGASKSRVWSQILADISGLPVKIPEIADLACVGAAILAGVGAGAYKDFRDGYNKFRISETVINPNPENVKKYAPLLSVYKKQAAALGEMYSE